MPDSPRHGLEGTSCHTTCLALDCHLLLITLDSVVAAHPPAGCARTGTSALVLFAPSEAVMGCCFGTTQNLAPLDDDAPVSVRQAKREAKERLHSGPSSDALDDEADEKSLRLKMKTKIGRKLGRTQFSDAPNSIGMMEDDDDESEVLPVPACDLPSMSSAGPDLPQVNAAAAEAESAARASAEAEAAAPNKAVRMPPSPPHTATHSWEQR